LYKPEAAASSNSLPFSAEAAEGKPITPLGLSSLKDCQRYVPVFVYLISVGPFETGTFISPASMTEQEVYFYVSDTETGTYNQLASGDETVVKITDANQAYAYPIPASALDGVKWLKIITQTNAVTGIRLTFN